MDMTWIKIDDGEFNEHAMRFDAEDDGEFSFQLYSNQDETEWTLRSPADDIIPLNAKDLRSAMVEASAEIKEWG